MILLVNFNRGTFVVTAGSNQEVILPCNNRANLRRLVLVQRTGALGGFTAKLYEAPLATRVLTSPAVYQVAPVVTALAGAAEALLFDNHGYPYQAVTTDQLPGSGIRNSELYLQINVAGAGAMTFDWVLAVEPML